MATVTFKGIFRKMRMSESEKHVLLEITQETYQDILQHIKKEGLKYLEDSLLSLPIFSHRRKILSPIQYYVMIEIDEKKCPCVLPKKGEVEPFLGKPVEVGCKMVEVSGHVTCAMKDMIRWDDRGDYDTPFSRFRLKFFDYDN